MTADRTNEVRTPSASPETGSEKHRDVAWELAEHFDSVCAEHGSIATDYVARRIAAALARVEAETRRQFDDERGALRAVLTPLRELADKATRGAWRVGAWNGKKGWPTVEVYEPPVRHEVICCLSYAEADHLHGMTQPNAEFIVAAVNAVSALLNAPAPEPVAGDAPPKNESQSS